MHDLVTIQEKSYIAQTGLFVWRFEHNNVGKADSYSKDVPTFYVMLRPAAIEIKPLASK